MASLRADMDNILEIRGTDPESTLVETTEDTFLVALFIAPSAPPPEPRERVKRNRSNHTSESENARSQKNKRTYLEAAMSVSFLDEEARHMRTRELAAGMSCSRVE